MGNRIQADLAKSYMDLRTAIEARRDDLRAEFMRENKALNQEIKDLLAKAKGDGVKPSALKALFKDYDLRKKIREIEEELAGDERDIFEQLTEALGEYAGTPLGAFAVAKASEEKEARRNAEAAAVDSLTDTDVVHDERVDKPEGMSDEEWNARDPSVDNLAGMRTPTQH